MLSEEDVQCLIAGGGASGADPPKVTRHEVKCPNIGVINVCVQGTRSPNEMVIMTVQDLGCDPEMMMEFTDHPRMVPIRDKTVWLHVTAPGQGRDCPDLPADYQYPSMRVIGEDLVHVLDHFSVKQVVCVGEGAGANILARFAMSHITRVLGVCLLHCTGSAASLQESVKEMLMRWKMDVNFSAEDYLIVHRFGGRFSKAKDKEDVRMLIEGFQETLRNKTNLRNVKKYVESYLRRSGIESNVKNLKCPVLLMTGQQSIFYESTKALHQAIVKSCADKSKVDFIEVADVANVLEEKPDKLAECLQYFLQGLGIVSSVPMLNLGGGMGAGGRRLSMEHQDKPARERKLSTGPPLSPIERKLSSEGLFERKLSSGTLPVGIVERKISGCPPVSPGSGLPLIDERLRSAPIPMTSDGHLTTEIITTQLTSTGISPARESFLQRKMSSGSSENEMTTEISERKMSTGISEQATSVEISEHRGERKMSSGISEQKTEISEQSERKMSTGIPAPGLQVGGSPPHR